MGNEKSNVGANLSYLLIGGGIGAILALLFAPKAGTELRADIADVTRQGLDKTEEFAGQLSETAKTVYTDTKTKAGEIYESAKKNLSSAATEIGEMPEYIEHAVQNKVEQISSSFEAGKKEYAREGATLNHQATANMT